MQIEPHAVWTSLHATLAQGGNANPLFNQANPGGQAPAPTDGSTPTTPGTGARGPAGGTPQGSLSFMLPLFIVLGGVILIQVFAARKQDKKRKSLLSAVKKYDKVVTIGGIIGTVVELRDDEVVLKVDEHSSTKIRFTRSAIQTVLRAPEESKGAEVVESKSKGESVGAKG